MIILGILSLLFTAGDTGIMQWANEHIGIWAFWVIIVGFLLFIPSAYYLYLFVRNLKEFRKLMTTNSKATFIKNQDRIEELAWRLHPKYEEMVIRKKMKLKIR